MQRLGGCAQPTHARNDFAAVESSHLAQMQGRSAGHRVGCRPARPPACPPRAPPPHSRQHASGPGLPPGLRRLRRRRQRGAAGWRWWRRRLWLRQLRPRGWAHAACRCLPAVCACVAKEASPSPPSLCALLAFAPAAGRLLPPAAAQRGGGAVVGVEERLYALQDAGITASWGRGQMDPHAGGDRPPTTAFSAAAGLRCVLSSLFTWTATLLTPATPTRAASLQGAPNPVCRAARDSTPGLCGSRRAENY